MARVTAVVSAGVGPGVCPGVSPGVCPGVSPGMCSGVCPGVSPGVCPGVSPGVCPGVSPGVGPGVDAAPTPRAVEALVGPTPLGRVVIPCLLLRTRKAFGIVLVGGRRSSCHHQNVAESEALSSATRVAVSTASAHVTEGHVPRSFKHVFKEAGGATAHARSFNGWPVALWRVVRRRRSHRAAQT